MEFVAIEHLFWALGSAGIAALVLCLWSCFSSGSRDPRLPPGKFPSRYHCIDQLNDVSSVGPPTIPLFGNELQIPKADAHFK